MSFNFVKSIGLIGVSTLLRNAVGPISFLILASYLPAEKIGQISLIIIFIGIANVITDFGIGQAIIKFGASKELINSVFTLNALFGILIGVVFLFAAHPVSKFYNDPALESLFIISSPLFVLVSNNLVYRSKFQSSLNFKISENILIVGDLVALSTLFLMLELELGVRSYIFALLISNLSQVVLNLYFLGKLNSLPQISFDFSRATKLYKFGGAIFGKALLNYISINFDKLIIGKFLGTSNLGIYHFGKNIGNKPSEISSSVISKFTFPFLSRRYDQLGYSNKLINEYLSLSKLLLVVQSFVFSLVFLNADLVLSFFDSSYSQSYIFIVIFLVKSLVNSFVIQLSTSLYYSMGKAKRLFMIFLITTPVRLIVIFLAAKDSLMTAALTDCSFVLINSIVINGGLIYTKVISVRQYLRITLKPFLAISSMAITVWFLSQFLSFPLSIYSVPVGLVFFLYCINEVKRLPIVSDT